MRPSAWGLLGCLLAGCGPGTPHTGVALPNDNRQPAGRRHGDTLDLELELRRVDWRPEPGAGAALPILAFAERSGPALVPGPLIRVPRGTLVRARVHNPLPDSTLAVYGLWPRLAPDTAPIRVAPGATASVTFTADLAGTWFYWGSTTGKDLDTREWLDSQLNGAFIVDSMEAPVEDRVFVLTIWSHFTDRPARTAPDTGELMAINGLAWPHTERLTIPVGDSVRWRLLNASSSSHPMHLHGTYFSLESRGDQARDTVYPPDRRPLEVTELLLTGGSATIRWAPARAGDWLFHCHFAFHVSEEVSFDRRPSHRHHRMAGLVLGITATGDDRETAAPRPRALRVLVQERAGRIRGSTGYGYVLQRGSAPAPDSIEIPGSPLILTRGEPVAITVVNRLAVPSAVHWHGMELASYMDGVPDVSGTASRRFRAIAPGDSFTAVFAPPRDGTFIYHTHFDDLDQMTRGLYGPLLVLPPGRPYDPATDHVVVAGGNGPVTLPDSVPGLVNGREDPAPIVLAAGRLNRLRLINIDPDHRIVFSLVRDTALVRWQALAKDGADLPPPLVTERPAELMTGPGETADFGYTPRRGERLTLRISAPFAEVPWTRTLALTAP
ncbi:MAG TPA: multicopper oxidase domain-containing protein [Gemmatimonadales bacterium]|nr:multicopper oxidase domain-containing protein [Gemmatimonadales bacterium]